MSPRPPRPTLFPYTTLFRSEPGAVLSLQAPGARQDRIEIFFAAGDGRVHARVHGSAHHPRDVRGRSEEHTSELQSRQYLVCRLLLEKKTSQCTVRGEAQVQL